MNTLAEVKKLLRNDEDSLASKRASVWLSRESTRPISSEPATITVAEAMRLWRTRLKTSAANPQGIPDLLKRLTSLKHQTKIEQFSFESDDSVASFVFAKTTRDFLGVVIVDRASSQKTAA